MTQIGERDRLMQMTGEPKVELEEVRGSEALARAKAVLAEARSAPSERHAALACELAANLWRASRAVETGAERRRRRRTARLVSDPAGQRFATALTDRICRIEQPTRRVEQIVELVRRLGVPESLGRLERTGLSLLPELARPFPDLAADALEVGVGREASAYVVRGRESELERFLRKAARSGTSVNLNHLGEEVVGEEQAKVHFDHYLHLLERPDVTTLSVKLSGIFSQTSLLAFEETLETLALRLRAIYEKASGARPQKLVYLDMEAYRDLDLTVELFTRLLSEPALLRLRAGIVLQAYLPDSHAVQKRLVAWARERKAAGGAPIRVRLVKGANLAMERVESSLRGWPVPVLPTKAAVDAHFKHMLRFACQPEAIDAVHVGVGSHNVFDVAYALVLREGLENKSSLELEMLHGMAEPLRRVVQELTDNVLVYVPSVQPEDFASAVAYLVRRFDENAAEENFLRHGFSMEVGDAAFQKQSAEFVQALEGGVVESTRRPTQRFLSGAYTPTDSARARVGFVNEPDTDLSRAGDRAFMLECLARHAAPVALVPLAIGERERVEGPRVPGFDPSRPGYVPYEHRVATPEEIEECLTTARSGAVQWAARSAEERVAVLRRVADELRRARGVLISAMVLDAGKRAEEADTEVSEAVDFAEYYASSYEEHVTELRLEPKGVVTVTPPWNFPLAIPLSGTLAALVAGNAVILKPAPETVLVAYLAAQACYRAGIPKNALAFVPCRETEAGPLIKDARVNAVVLTGATETARLFRRMRPGLDLLAETGGKNAMVVSCASDPELAIRDAVRSAFGHAGQKCSALSLLIVERDLYRSADFRRQLRDAAQSLTVGSAWNPVSYVTPLIHPPSPTLARGLTLEAGERWLLAPTRSRDNERLVGPSIKLDVVPGSFSHRTELFGPALSVIEAESVQRAIAVANDTPYGLTAGFHGLDEREQRLFIESMQAGNLYVNRTITGAIVGRQPFGGRKASCFGPGAKAGGPNYVLQMCHVLGRRTQPKSDRMATGRAAVAAASRGPTSGLVARYLGKRELERLERRVTEYEASLQALGHPKLLQQLVGEANWFRLTPCECTVVLGAGVSDLDAASVLFVLELLATPAKLLVLGEASARPAFDALVSAGRAESVESLDDVKTLLLADASRRVRIVGVPPEDCVRVLGALDAHVCADPVSEVGQVELLRYLIEQSISVSQHRYGNLGMAAVSPTPRGLAR